MWVRAAALAAVAAALAGCAHTVDGGAVADPGQPVSLLGAGDTGEVLVAPSAVHDIVGSRLQVDADQTRPVAGESAVAACSALDSVGMAAFVGRDWSSIRVLLFTGDRRNPVVSEAVTVYPDAGAAAAAFRTGTRDVAACDGQRALGTGSGAAWKFAVQERNSDTVRWTKQQIAIPLDWVCTGESRLRNNAILQAMACQDDDGGSRVVTTLADRMSARVWELSTR